MGDYGLKIAKGININSPEPRDFIFNSKYGSVKIAKEAGFYKEVTINGPASTTKTVTIPHNLGFPPMFMVFLEATPVTGQWYCGWSIPGNVNLLPGGGGTSSDNTNIYLVFRNNTATAKTIKYYYYIFGDSG